ncbi:ferric reductase-like transmembrane domain-containing protein [Halobacillus sp. BBL2006]|uniref:ferric reductase-like transmembrane domain-containing protein n=1 Tax=Halobacillus sp. BBL2006 TaxID=1543706 RepID=UPI0006897553|nr:ferric reductase-like transmembrane domain-containing protein [Halobacillus sp. BBL2006]
MEISTWEWTRISGLTSFFLLFLSILIGLLQSSPLIHPKWRGSKNLFHQLTGWVGFLLMIFHGVILIYDHYVSYQWYEIFVPFTSDEHRILTGIGTLSLYGVFLILLSSDMMKKVGYSIWKKIHLFSLPAYLLVLLHGFFIGSDTSTEAIPLMYAGTTLLLTGAYLAKRVSGKGKTKTAH